MITSFFHLVDYILWSQLLQFNYIEFGYKYYDTKEELTKNYERLWEEEIFPNIEKGLSAAIYTQVSDVENECNGLMTYDREIAKIDASVIINLNARLYEIFSRSVR